MALSDLTPLVGEWQMEAFNDGEVVARGKCVFAWINDGSFLVQHVNADPWLPNTPQVWIDNSPFPITVIISYDDFHKKFTYSYSDGRGVHRVYDMSFKNGVWKTWGQADSKFYQRSVYKITKDGKTMDVVIERSTDNKTWQLDFKSKYTKLTGL